MKQMIAVWKPKKKGGMKLTWKNKKVKKMKWLKNSQKQKNTGELRSQKKLPNTKPGLKNTGKNEESYLKNNLSDSTYSDSVNK